MSETYKNVEMQVLGETGYETIYPVPAGHKESHISGNDRITPADIGAQEAIVGTEGQTVVIGSNGKPTVANGVSSVVEQNNNLPQKFWRGTQSEYDAIETKDDNTMYIITDASGEPIQYGDMLKSDYDPQNRNTDIFKYVDEHATNIPITSTPSKTDTIWIDPKEEGDGVGGSSIAIQPEQPVDGSEIWIDTDDESGEGTGMGYSKAEINELLQNKIDAFSGAGAHNSIYRGKYLGDSVTAEQYAAISAGTFDDLYIGDYWTINGVNYRIAAFDYYLNTGDTACNTHHVTLVPDAALYSHVINDTNTTEGGYIGSKMKTSGLDQAVTTINNAFGSAHILTHRQYLCNAVSNGKPSGCSWYGSTVELMTEQNVYGGKVFGAGNDGSTVPTLYTVDKSQYPLFAFRPDMISNRVTYWLRDVVSAADFAYVSYDGDASYLSASYALGVRPAFSIKA